MKSLTLLSHFYAHVASVMSRKTSLKPDLSVSGSTNCYETSAASCLTDTPYILSKHYSLRSTFYLASVPKAHITLKILFRPWGAVWTADIIPFRYRCGGKIAQKMARHSLWVVSEFCSASAKSLERQPIGLSICFSCILGALSFLFRRAHYSWCNGLVL